MSKLLKPEEIEETLNNCESNPFDNEIKRYMNKILPYAKEILRLNKKYEQEQEKNRWRYDFVLEDMVEYETLLLASNIGYLYMGIAFADGDIIAHSDNGEYQLSVDNLKLDVGEIVAWKPVELPNVKEK